MNRLSERILGVALLTLFCSGSAVSAVSAGEEKSAPNAKEKTQVDVPTKGSNKEVQGVAIPSAPATEIEIKELKTTMAVDVLASRSKVFRTKQKINRVAVSDPSVADVVLMTENQFVVIGKNPGAISVTIWCDNK